MTEIPDNFQLPAGFEPIYEESARLKQLRAKAPWLEIGAKVSTAVAAVGPFSAVLGSIGLFGAARRTREAIARRAAEERAAALEAARRKAYEARYGKFDLLTATINAQRQNPASLMDALRRAQR